MRSNRRRFFQAVGTGAAGMTIGGSGMAAASAGSDKAGTEEDGPVLQIGDDIAVADTQYGKVRGYVLRGIHYFLGIPYGADTSGANRFMPPQKPKPWTDVRPALWWGNTAPQNMDNRYANPYASFRDHWNYDDVSEDCLKLNVFTPALKDGKKRPVLFWIHGGGFANGNGIEHDGYNGENFARLGDAVFCSINHRLGPLGYCNLAGVGGEKFAASGNVGMLDIVARARMGPRQHRELRRRPGQRDDHGSVRRRGQGLHADRDAVREGSVPQGGGGERRLAEDGREGRLGEARRVRPERSRARRRPRSTSCRRCPGRTTSPSPRRPRRS